MGDGIDLCRADAPEHARYLDNFKDQLIIALINKLADKEGVLEIPIKEVDSTGQFLLYMSANGINLHFEIRKKS